MATVAEQSVIAMQQWSTSRRNNLSASTLRIYGSYFKNWIVPKLGTLDLGAVQNGEMKALVDVLVAAELSPATISGITTCLKKLVGSATDVNGNRLFPITWNSAFIDAPALDPSKQKTPTIDPKALSAALKKTEGLWTALFALQAGCGLRISETIAIRKGPDTGIGSCWDVEGEMLHIREQIGGDGKVGPLKTTASVRTVNVYPKLNEWLARRLEDKQPGELLFSTRSGHPLHQKTINAKAHAAGIPATHCLRRFRVTHLDQVGVRRRVVDYWIGHVGENITDRYSRPEKVAEWLKTICERSGIGFELPKNEEIKNENAEVSVDNTGIPSEGQLDASPVEQAIDLREMWDDQEPGSERSDVPCDIYASVES